MKKLHSTALILTIAPFLLTGCPEKDENGNYKVGHIRDTARDNGAYGNVSPNDAYRGGFDEPARPHVETPASPQICHPHCR